MSKNRIDQEKRVVELMIRLYCRKKEKNVTLCPRCEELLHYAHARLDHCPFGGEKESMQAVQHTLLQTRHAGTDETGDALFRSPDADLRSLGGNQTSVGIDMVGSEND